MKDVETTTIDIKRSHKDFTIPIYSHIPDDCRSDEPIVYSPGLGSRKGSQKRALVHMGEVFKRPIYGYDARLPAQTKDPWDDVAEYAHDTHQRVITDIGLEKERYDAVGQSIGSLAIGAVLEKQAGQLRRVGLITPALISSDAIVSHEWRDMMRGLTIVERAKLVRENEPHWKRNTLAAIAGFGLITLFVEGAKRLREPSTLVSAGYHGFIDTLPSLSMHPFPPTVIGAFGVAANVSIISEVDKADGDDTNIEFVLGEHDATFPYRPSMVALENFNRSGNTITISKGLGAGHNNPVMKHGRAQMDYLEDFLAA